MMDYAWLIISYGLLIIYNLFLWGVNSVGNLGQNSIVAAPGGISSPVQVTGSSWTNNFSMDFDGL